MNGSVNGNGNINANEPIKMNKAQVLMEAVQYFKQLQEENSVLLRRLELLLRRLRATRDALDEEVGGVEGRMGMGLGIRF